MEWLAFDYGGKAYALGDCGDYDAAVEVADDCLTPEDGKIGGSQWAFILSVQELKEILRAAETCH